MSPPTRLASRDGLEMQFQVNFLSHWLLAHELLAEQRRRRARDSTGRQRRQQQQQQRGNDQAASTVNAAAAPPAAAAFGGGCPCGAGGTRLVTLSSLTHHAGRLQWDDMQSQQRRYSPFKSYALSKLCNVAAACEFQRRFERHDACRYGHDSAVAVHPGIVNTHLATGFFSQTGRAALPALERAVVQPLLALLYPAVLRSPESSADAMLLAVTAPPARVAGRYLSNGRLARPDKYAEDPERGRELWEVAERLTGVKTNASLA